MQHLDSIFEPAIFRTRTGGDFLNAYARAHPVRQEGGDAAMKTRVISWRLPISAMHGGTGARDE